MCRPVTCNVCGKTTWAGCGQHINQVKAQVPRGQWCDGKHTPAEIKAAQDAKPKGLFSAIFGGR